MRIEIPEKSSTKEMVIVLLVTPVLLTLFMYHGTTSSLSGLARKIGGPGADNVSYFSTVLQFVAVFVFLFAIPALIAKFALKSRLKDYGLCLGDARFGLKLTAIAVPLVVLPILYIGSRFPEVRAYYPLCASAKVSARAFLFYLLAYGLYYFGWEFFFRGFMIFGLKDSLGKTAAILISVIPSCIMHYAKPEIETWCSIPVGILFGIVSVRARSFLYVFIIHWAAGVANDIFVTYF
jgi:membrane protease YdiL (CAAX protease family)